MIVERLTKPTVTAYNTSELMFYARVDSSAFANELDRHADAATVELEAYAQLALIDQTIRVTLDTWPRSAVFSLPIAPIVDPLSVAVTVDGEDFDAFSVVTGKRPALRFSDARPCGVVVITYLAGFGPNQTDVPADLVNVIMDQASANFEHKGVGDGKSNGMSPHMARVAARYRRVAL